MAGCMEGFKRANSKNRKGDLKGPITGAKNDAPLPLNVENGKVVLWAVNLDDIVIEADKVVSVTLVQSGVRVKNLASGGGKDAIVNIYTVAFKDGTSATMRLLINSAHEVLSIWGK